MTLDPCSRSMFNSADPPAGPPVSQGSDWGVVLSQGEGDRGGRGRGRDKDSAGGREVGLGGRGGAEELLDLAGRSGFPLHSRRRSEEEWEVRRGGSGE